MKKKNLAEHYRDVFRYLKETKSLMWFIFVSFIVIACIGFIFPIFFVEEIHSYLSNLVNQIKEFNIWQMIWFIFKNNLWGAFFGMIMGILLCIVPLISIAVNGYILGFIARGAVDNSSILSLWRLFPHGIFELPAIILSLALGTKLGMIFFGKNIKKEFSRRFLISIKIFFLVILPLLIVAAIIEGSLIVLLG